MAYREEKSKIALRIDVDNGLDTYGNERVKSKSFKNVNTEASNDAIGECGKILSGFFKKEVKAMKKLVEYDLIEE